MLYYSIYENSAGIVQLSLLNPSIIEDKREIDLKRFIELQRTSDIWTREHIDETGSIWDCWSIRNEKIPSKFLFKAILLVTSD